MVEVTYTYAKKPVQQKPLTTILDTPSKKPVTKAQVVAAAKKLSNAHCEAKNVEAAVALTAARTEKPKYGAPSHPIPDALLAAGFKFARTEKKDKVTAHGYIHPDGRAALFTYNGKANTEAWRLQLTDGGSEFGKDAKALAKRLAITKTAKPVKVAAKAVAAPVVLPKGNVIAALKLLKGDFDLTRFKNEETYGQRMALLKKLRSTTKVLAKENTYKALVTEFSKAVDKEFVPSHTSLFAARCHEILKGSAKVERTAAKTEKERVAHILATTGVKKIVRDGKPIITIKKKSKRQRDKEMVSLQAELATAIRKQREEDAAVPIMRPRPEAVVEVDAANVRLLEDPKNGIAILQLERENSQGAVCVYNNGSRVAAGVIPPEIMKSLRQIQNADVLKAANQLLNPIVATVPVTPVAHRHLTAVLHCKELIPMADTKKFAAPAKSVPAKATKTVAKAEKPAKKTAAKKEVAAPRNKFSDDLKITILHKDKENPNPYREGTKARSSFELLVKSKTFGDYSALTAKSKADVYEAAYFAKWASQAHGNAPAYIRLG